MQKKNSARQASVIRSLRIMLAFWFFAGMPLSIGLSGLYFVVAIPVPPLLNVLSSMVYLSGGLLGVLWGGDNLWGRKSARIDLVATFFVLTISMGFLLLGMVFAFRAFRRL